MPIYFQLQHNFAEHQTVVTKELGYSNNDNSLNCSLLHTLFQNNLFFKSFLPFLFIASIFSRKAIFKNQLYLQHHFNFKTSRGPPRIIF